MNFMATLSLQDSFVFNLILKSRTKGIHIFCLLFFGNIFQYEFLQTLMWSISRNIRRTPHRNVSLYVNFIIINTLNVYYS